MDQAPLLDFEALIAPIPGDDPAGSSAVWEVLAEIKEARTEIDPQSYAPDDPMRPSERKSADWKGIIRLAADTLAEKSKHIDVATRLVEALSKQHGFAGLRAGFEVLRRLTTDCWDRLHPTLDDSEALATRAEKLMWLNDDVRGVYFPVTVRSLPIVSHRNKGFGWMEWKASHERGGEFAEEFEAAWRNSSLEALQESVALIDACVKELMELKKALDEKMGAESPSLSELRQAVLDSQTLARHILAQVAGTEGAGDAADDSAMPGNSEGGSPPSSSPGRGPNTREEAYRQLKQAAAVLRRLEPHSPIPFLIERACALGSLQFPDMIRALIRDGNVLNELRRELGLPSDPSISGE